MNKLVIIGNGFDLAHGLPTRYEDYLLWEINEAFKNVDTKKIDNDFFKVQSRHSGISHPDGSPFVFKSIMEFEDFFVTYKEHLSIDFKNDFFKNIIRLAADNWVDIEREYFRELVKFCDLNIDIKTRNQFINDLNTCVDLIRKRLEKYLLEQDCSILSIDLLENVKELFESKLNSDNMALNKTYFLNFNYTNTIESYFSFYQKYHNVIHIHGRLGDKMNPIIFGYGDETDENYERIEKLNDNNLLRHMKSFAYLQSNYYKELFNFIEMARVDVFIIGHSCGLSDRLLFKHIFEHKNFNSVQLYFHQKGERENDFFEKTQNLSRYFDFNSKHRMRTKVISFNESKPLTPFQNQN